MAIIIYPWKLDAEGQLILAVTGPYYPEGISKLNSILGSSPHFLEELFMQILRERHPVYAGTRTLRIANLASKLLTTHCIMYQCLTGGEVVITYNPEEGRPLAVYEHGANHITIVRLLAEVLQALKNRCETISG